MFDSQKELLDKIRLGESTFLECKEVRFAGGKVSQPHRDALADGLAAFANSRGGVFVLGVEDKTHEVVGIPVDRLDAVTDFIQEVCIDSIKPAIENFVLDRLWLPSSAGDEVAVVKVDIPWSLFVHSSPNGYFRRLANSKRRMSTESLARLFQQRSQTRVIHFDEQIVSSARLENLTPSLWERFRTPRSDDDREDFLRKLGIARTDEDGTVKPTVTGVLIASEEPRQWLPNAYIQAVAYRGTSIGPSGPADAYQLDAADITGPLDRQVSEACRFVARNMRMVAFKDQGHQDQPQFDMTAVFEALVNAVAHRDYSIHGSKVRLRLFEDRLELYSPGTIPNTMTVESLPYRQVVRNETISSLLAQCTVPANVPGLETDRRTLMDKRGEGVRIILDNSERLSGKTPEYRLIDDAELLLTIHSVIRS